MSADGELLDATKACYEHDFVVLAAASAAAVGVTGADDLLADALRVHERPLPRPRHRAAAASRGAGDWSVGEAYRGANSSMHAVEA